MPSMIRRSALALLIIVPAVALLTCGTQGTPRCQASNCSGCCAEDGTCLGPAKQSFNQCGASGKTCGPCLPGQMCTGGRCVADPDGGSGIGGGGGDIGGGAGGGGGA